MESAIAGPSNDTIANDNNAQSNAKNDAVDANLDWTEMTSQALQRVHEFVQQSLHESPPQVAAMDTSTGLFYRALFQLNLAVDEALPESIDPIGRVDGMARAIDLMLRIARQIDRYGQLRTLLMQARRTLPNDARTKARSEEIAF